MVTYTYRVRPEIYGILLDVQELSTEVCAVGIND